MVTTSPTERLARLLRHIRDGWRVVRADARARETVRAFLASHPSPRSDVDALWEAALSDGAEPIGPWLDAGADPDTWPSAIPLHTALASHPFRCLPRWSSPNT